MNNAYGGAKGRALYAKQKNYVDLIINQILRKNTINHFMAQDPLHGITLKHIVTELEARFGWDELYHHLKFNCFHNNPSINSSLKFLRKTPWARAKIEAFYLQHSIKKTNQNIWNQRKT